MRDAYRHLLYEPPTAQDWPWYVEAAAWAAAIAGGAGLWLLGDRLLELVR